MSAFFSLFLRTHYNQSFFIIYSSFHHLNRFIVSTNEKKMCIKLGELQNTKIQSFEIIVQKKMIKKNTIARVNGSRKMRTIYYAK